MIMMKPRYALAIGLACASLAASVSVLAAAEATQPKPKVLATVNGKTVTEDDLKLAMEDLGPSLPAQLKGQGARDLFAGLSHRRPARRPKGARRQTRQDPDFTSKLAYLRDKALMEVILHDAANAAATDEILHKTYDEAAAAQKPEAEFMPATYWLRRKPMRRRC